MNATRGTMPETLVIEPNAVYDDGRLCIALGLASATLARERREGRLRFTRKGNRTLYIGQWVLDWLKSADRREVVNVA